VGGRAPNISGLPSAGVRTRISLVLAEWIGRTQRTFDWITPNRISAWHATLDHGTGTPGNGGPAPLGFHWTLAQPTVRESELGPDGHARRGAFLPPIELPRRLWAGSRVRFSHPLRVGERVERRSEIASITEKTGRDSPLVFVTVRHQLVDIDGIAIEEEQDLVYHGAPSKPPSEPRTSESSRMSSWQRTIHPTETLLFRYSALTFNTHRIHYDRRYATEVEHYPGLVVHGPLIATLLLDLAQTAVDAERIERFHFRAKRPTFDTSDFSVCGAPAGDGHCSLWSTDNHGALAVDAEAWFR
jgi:3-methylfumaryl-CoA hydratase